MKILWHVVCHWWLINGLGFWKDECSIAEIETDRDEDEEVTDGSTIVFFSKTR
jgi:hypothetical protein